MAAYEGARRRYGIDLSEFMLEGAKQRGYQQTVQGNILYDPLLMLTNDSPLMQKTYDGAKRTILPTNQGKKVIMDKTRD